MNTATREETAAMTLEMEPVKAQQLPAIQPTGALSVDSPAGIMFSAMARGMSLADMREVLSLQREWDADQAAKLHAKAMAGFKSEAVQVVRSKLITDGPLRGKKHAELSDITDAVTEALSKYGLSATYRVVEDSKDWIKIGCRIKHEAGHVEETQFGGPIDTGPGRNAMQARKSSVTYLERITLLLALGLSEADADDDGAGGPKDDQSQALLDKFRAASMEGTAALRKLYNDEQPPDAFWAQHSKSLKAAAKKADEAAQ